MQIKFSPFSRLALASLLAGTGAFSHAQDSNIKPMSKVQAAAACDTLVEKIEGMRQQGAIDNATRQVRLCDEAITSIYENLRRDGSEYFVGGIGVFLGVEVNSPTIKRLSAGARVAVGGSMFATDNPTFRFTPMINVVPVSGQVLIKGTTQMVEPQLGVIVYLGSHATKSINDLNGLYAGVTGEMPNFFSSEQLNRSSITFNILKNRNNNLAIVAMKSFNAGSNMAALGATVMNVNNITRDGAGSSFSAMFRGIGGEFSDIVTSSVDTIWNAMKGPFVK